MLDVDWSAVSKRTMDVTVAAVALVLVAPLMLLIALLIVVDSPGPVFFRAERVGRGGRPLRMLKFRKMHAGAIGLALTVAGDRRLTRVGAVLVRTRLDELPQLWHVLRGDMSLVGPRPEDPTFVAHWPQEYEEILQVRPGLTGWTQLAFADEARILGPRDPLTRYLEVLLPQKVQLDRLYATRASVRADVHICVATFRALVLRQPIAVHRGSGAMNVRRRPVIHTVAETVPTPEAAVVAEAPAATR
jgi:lipopolysaccharide/colanic/teichoic acid biosynthesis glycosyltransferase